MAQNTQSLLDWILTLLNSPEEQEAFKQDPEGYLEDHGWEDLTPQDLYDVLPLVIENTQEGTGNQQGFLNNQQDFSTNQSLDNSSDVSGGNINFGGANAAQFGSEAGNAGIGPYDPGTGVYSGATVPSYTGMEPPPDASPAEAVIHQLHFITNNFTADQRVTNVDNSINQNVDTDGGDFDQTIDNDPVQAFGDGAQAAGENLVNAEEGAVVAGDDLEIEDSNVVTGEVEDSLLADDIDDSNVAVGERAAAGEGNVTGDVSGDGNAFGAGAQAISGDDNQVGDGSAFGAGSQVNTVDASGASGDVNVQTSGGIGNTTAMDDGDAESTGNITGGDDVNAVGNLANSGDEADVDMQGNLAAGDDQEVDVDAEVTPPIL